MRMKRFLSLILIAFLAFTTLTMAGCSGGKGSGVEGYTINSDLNTDEQVEIRIGIHTSAWEELEYVTNLFETVYPNCTIVTEYIEEYYTNIETRLAQEDNKLDVFVTTNIQETSSTRALKNYALNLISTESAEILDLSKCHQGIVDNFKYTAAEDTQYAVPYGGEMRGTYVNVTLLKKLGLDVPTNRAELFECCEALLDAGYVPFQSGQSTFGQQLIYPYICNLIVNGGDYEQAYEDVSNIVPGVSEYFEDAYSLMYEIVEKGYFDVATAKEKFGYKFSGSDGVARDFLDITLSDDGVNYEKNSDEGNIAFLVSTQSLKSYLEQSKTDYHSEIEYQFIAHPIATDGGYAYLSPSDGMAINKNSDNIDWSLEFLNFFFTPSVNKEFARRYSKIPNTADALLEYEIDSNHACDVGQVTFDYQFYQTTITLLTGGYSEGSYSVANANFREVFPDMTYYYRVKEDGKTTYDYYVASAEYIAANPTATIYRANVPMVGMGRMNDPVYANADGTIKFTLQDYLDRLEQEFIYAKASRDGAQE